MSRPKPKVCPGQIWVSGRGVERQVSGVYRPVVGYVRQIEHGVVSEEIVPQYGEQHAILYAEIPNQRAEIDVPVARLHKSRKWTLKT